MKFSHNQTIDTTQYGKYSSALFDCKRFVLMDKFVDHVISIKSDTATRVLAKTRSTLPAPSMTRLKRAFCAGPDVSIYIDFRMFEVFPRPLLWPVVQEAFFCV